MKILELHQIEEKYLKKDYYKQFDILTFDDGLYSQFYYKDFFKSLNKHLIYFISSGIINNTNNFTFKDCLDAHNDFFTKNDLSAYMNLKQIEELAEFAEIGWHTHFHPYLPKFSKIKQMQIILNEIKLGSSFIKKFNCNKFCFPYNYKNNFFLYNLKKIDFNSFFSDERINFESYIFNQQQNINSNQIKCYYIK